jgi:hypothetical protein
VTWDRTEVLQIIARCGFDEIQACKILRILDRESRPADQGDRIPDDIPVYE